MSETETLPQGGDGGAAPDNSAIEEKARRLGWVPKDEFKGDPDKHRSAEEFLKRGEEILPILKRDNEKLHTLVGSVQKELQETRETLKQFSEFAGKAEERAYKKAKAELEAKLDAAIQNADVTAAQQARREMADLEADKPAPPSKPDPEAPKVDPAVKSWIDENPWFNSDAALRGYAVKVFGNLERATPGRSKSDMLAETKRAVMEKFPEDFGINPRRETAAAVSTPSGETGRRKSGGRTYDDLPPEAKKACDKFVRTIPGYTKDKYIKDYEWD